MNLKKSRPFIKEGEKKGVGPQIGIFVRSSLVLGAWILFFFSSYLFSLFLGGQSQIVGNVYFYSLPLFFIVLEVVLKVLKDKLSSSPIGFTTVIIFNLYFFAKSKSL